MTEEKYLGAIDKVFNCFVSSKTVKQMVTSEKVMFNFFKLYEPDMEVRITMVEHYARKLKHINKGVGYVSVS